MAEMTGQQIYDNFQNGGGPEGLANCSAAIRGVTRNYQIRMLHIQQLVAEMESAWEGPASEGARAGAGPLLKEHGSASEHFGVAEDLTDRQSGSFSRAKNTVVPVPPAPQDVIPWGPMDPGWLPYLQQLNEHGKAAQHNVDVMTDYSGASTYNTENLPTRYGEMAVDQSGIAVGGGDTIDSESFRHAGDSGYIAGPRPGGGEPGTAEFGPRGGSPVGGPSGGDSGGVGPGGVGPGTVGPGGFAGGASGGQGTLPSDVTTPGGYSPLPGGYGGAPLPSSGDSSRGATPGGPLAGVGFGPGGSGPGAGSSEGRSPLGAGGPRSGVAVPRGGFGVGAGVPNEVLPGGRPAAGTGGARGAAGMHGMPLGSGRGRDEEDQEHRLPTYLEGGDPEDIFGSEILTAPPVIGEDDD